MAGDHRARVEQVPVQGDRVTAETLVAVLRNPEMDLALADAHGGRLEPKTANTARAAARH